jgi:hypothetical protein
MREHAAEPGAQRTASQPQHKVQAAPTHAPLATGRALDALQLQRLAGNRAVAAIVDRVARETLQRVAVKESPPNETLYNQPGAGGKAGIEDEMGRAIGADRFAVLAHINVDMGMVERGQRANALEFL